MITKLIHITNTLWVFSVCLVAASVNTGEERIQHVCISKTDKKTFALSVITAVIWTCYEDARNAATEITLDSVLVGLYLMRKLPFSDTMQQNIQTKIDSYRTHITLLRTEKTSILEKIQIILQKHKEFIYWLVI